MVEMQERAVIGPLLLLRRRRKAKEDPFIGPQTHSDYVFEKWFNRAYAAVAITGLVAYGYFLWSTRPASFR